MKKVIGGLSVIAVVLSALFVLFCEPIKLVGEDSVRWTLHVGNTIPLVAIAEVAGGYRCYVNDEEYFWLSTDDCTQEVGDPLRAKYRFNAPAIIYRGDT